MSDDAAPPPSTGSPTGSPAGSGPEAPPASPPPSGQTSTSPLSQSRTEDPLRGSRTSGIWVAVVGLGLVLLLLVIFIAQNTQTVNVAFLGWEGTAPLSVTLLAAAVGGLFLAVAAGTLRILQLRRRVRRDKKA
jgi:uncharacterized integral membrane protein